MNNKRFDSLRAPFSALIASASLTASVATAALTVALLTLGSSVGYAQSNTEGYIYGAGAPAGSTVSAVSLTTGQKRDALVDASGNYRISSPVTCPWHGWTYGLHNGKAIVPPVGIRVRVFPVTVVDGMIFADIEWE